MNGFYLLAEVLPTQKNLSFGEILSYGGSMLVVGLGVVFAVLALLWVLLEIFGRVAGKMTATEKPQKPAAVATPAAPLTAKPADDLELIAVLTAAIAASESQSPARFRVVSFKRK